MGTVAASADIASLAADLQQAGQTIDSVAAQTVRSIAEATRDNAQALAPRKTGKLAASITISYVDPLKAVVYPGVNYGVYQEYGTSTRGEFPTGPYTIRPKNKQALHFKVGNKWVTVKSAKGLGVPPHPFMRPAFEAALGDSIGKLANNGALLITEGKTSGV